MGYNLKKMIYDVGGGIADGKKLKAVVPGGSSTFLLTAEEAEAIKHGLRLFLQSAARFSAQAALSYSTTDLHGEIRPEGDEVLSA